MEPRRMAAVFPRMPLMGLVIRVVLVLGAWAPACGYAEKPIILVNPYPASGLPEIAGSTATNKVLRIMQNFATPPATDVVAERVGQSMGAAIGRAVIVQRRARGRSILGARFVAGSAPDGRTLLFSKWSPVIGALNPPR